jgi:hypothetical protein
LIPKKYPGEAAIVCGTGPSIDQRTIDLVNSLHADECVRVFSANRAHEVFDTDVFHACNWQFYDFWWERTLRDRSFDKWTTRPELQGKYEGVEYIEERWEDGISRDPSYICAHHGTGPQLVNIAYLYGCTKILLVGWDMRFWGKVDQRTYAQRRYFPEYELTLNHWPMTGANGEMSGLIKEMETIDPSAYNIQIINCTPGSALTHFPMMGIIDALAAP